MVVAATCGNSVFVTSSPSSIAIRDILCSEGEEGCEELDSQAFLALATAALLGLWVPRKSSYGYFMIYIYIHT